jgi:hypothetical protein
MWRSEAKSALSYGKLMFLLFLFLFFFLLIQVYVAQAVLVPVSVSLILGSHTFASVLHII